MKIEKKVEVLKGSMCIIINECVFVNNKLISNHTIICDSIRFYRVHNILCMVLYCQDNLVMMYRKDEWTFTFKEVKK